MGPSWQFELSHLSKGQTEKTNEMTEVTALLKLRDLYLQRSFQVETAVYLCCPSKIGQESETLEGNQWTRSEQCMLRTTQSLLPRFFFF